MGTAKQVAEALTVWNRVHGRRLPWREREDTYALAVAEVLLQKTKGEDVVPVWKAVIAAYPNLQTLAKARKKDLRALVASLGLGKQRVGRLRAMAQATLGARKDGIPGLGPYATGILALLRGEEPEEPPIDGNIARVITRLFGLTFERGEPRKKTEVKENTAALLATQSNTGDRLRLVYAMVDLGAKVCKAATPECPSCPLARCCVFAASRALFK